ncbi:hypothetical protein KKG41_03220 [Patescibacteria group bacterium]|nr:hypothetical protein [Patescibacteria group bacterium]
MKKLVCALSMIALIVPALAFAVNVDDTAIVSGWEWVDVLNDKPVTQHFSNGESTLKKGETCGIEEGGTITVVKVNGQKLLVEYTAPGSPMGTPCPSGVLFEIATSDFETMTAEYNRVIEARSQKQLKVIEILGSMKRGDSASVPSWDWVDVLNPTPVTQNFRNGNFPLSYEETCGIEAGGIITVLGEMSSTTLLVEYTAPGSPMGTPCPSGVLFEIKKDDFNAMRRH